MKEKNPGVCLIKTHKHQIKLKSEFRPKFKVYPVPIHLKGDVKNHLKELEEQKIISKKEVLYASPAFPVRKKNNKIRLVIDYRELNKCTEPFEIAFPTISEIFSSLNGSKIFSSIDLNQGYYQIEMADGDVDKTAFRIDKTTYVLHRMLFGLSNAPRTFTKAIRQLLGEMEYVKIYMDDLLIHSSNEETHYEHLKKVLSILHNHGASVNFEKSQFNKNQVRFLGHIIDKTGVRADITTFNNSKLVLTRNPKELQKLLGFLNWFRSL
ncbi:Retrovirus-related Pol polyprotein from transposon opus [Dictyocoela muelleri]|nr:Retrovirus-related Pol polyprotein from transposon opus [Dictyocoela muelleri]